MANWYGSARSNYFKVRDLDLFKQEFEELCDIVVREDGTVGVFPNDYTDDGSFPSYRTEVGTDEAGDEYEDDVEFNFVEAVSKHLTEDSIAIFMCAGAEKLRYISGWAEAINHKGERKTICLCDILSLAKETWPNATITDCSY